MHRPLCQSAALALLQLLVSIAKALQGELSRDPLVIKGTRVDAVEGAEVETELPSRTDHHLFVQLTPQQRDIYAGYEEQAARLAARGLLPDDWVDAFAWCRDQVPPLRPGKAESIVEQAFDRPLGEMFSEFDPTPLGSASIGQAHAAVLVDGTEVVVKVRRPHLRSKFDEAIRSLALIVAAAEGRIERARMANLSGAVELFAELVLEELDFRFEALNMVELGLVTEHAGMSGDVRVPRPIPHLVTERVLVMERMPGRPYNEAAEVVGVGLDGDRLLRTAIQGVLEHALAYGIFHGDLHAGNVLVDAEQRFSLIDFGICGRVDAAGRRALVRLTVAYAQDDGLGQVRALQGFGALPSDVDVTVIAAQLDAAAADVRARFGGPDGPAGVTLAQVAQSMGATMQMLAANGFHLPKDLVLFFKNLLYLNGFADAVAPDANVLSHVDPILAHFQARHGATLVQLLAE